MNTIAIQGLKGLLCGIRLADIYSQLKIQGLKPDETEKRLLEVIGKGAKGTDDVLLTDFFLGFKDIFEVHTEMPAQLKAFDNLMASHPELTDFKEYCFDLFFVQALESLGEDADAYMESPAWQKIEQQTEGRGTEALNLFMYLTEVNESDLKASMDDFLDGFILDEDLDYQDDASIYEEMMSNRNWLELTYSEMVAKAEAMEEETAMPEIFTPAYCFFKSPEKSNINLMACLQAGGQLKRNTAVSAMLQFFYHGEKCINQEFAAFLG